MLVYDEVRVVLKTLGLTSMLRNNRDPAFWVLIPSVGEGGAVGHMYTTWGTSSMFMDYRYLIKLRGVPDVGRGLC